jgi:hypothetical protein
MELDEFRFKAASLLFPLARTSRQNAAMNAGKKKRRRPMAIELNEKNTTKILAVRLSGKLMKEDYETLVPEFERLQKEHGKLRILLEMVDFHGWKAGALWEDVKFDLKHFTHIERLAMVGDKRWEKAMSFFCKPFTTATIRYFDRFQIAEARAWLESD